MGMGAGMGAGGAELAEGARAAFKERIRQRQAALQIAPFAARMSKRGKKDNVLVGTLEGGVGLLSALEEKAYRRLALLQQVMLTSVRSVCALNPREFRLLKTAHFRAEKKRGVLDGALLYLYVCMDGVMQDEIAAAMGVTADLLLGNLREIDQSAAVF
jgi:cleavage and polyadenylation specificity factor subunit 1